MSINEWTRYEAQLMRDEWDERCAKHEQDAWYDARRVAAQKGEQNEQPIP